MNDILYYILAGVLVVGVLAGIAMMSRVQTAVWGNALSSVCMAAAIVLILVKNQIVGDWLLWAALAVGLGIGLVWAARAKMIQMPQIVALFNGFGGGASALMALLALWSGRGLGPFAAVTAALALAVGAVTLTGSLVAAGKLQKLLPQKPVTFPAQTAACGALLLVSLAAVAVAGFLPAQGGWLGLVCGLAGCGFGAVFALRVGGADMPITISLLNSLSGVAGAIAGMAVGDPILVAVGGIVGASGLLLTQIMCRAMNRSLPAILFGRAVQPASVSAPALETAAETLEFMEVPDPEPETESAPEQPIEEILAAAKKVILIPGYGMALAQAQGLVKELADRLEQRGADVKFAIHPVAGRMPGHMNVLLAEADIPYEKLYEIGDINPEFEDCDLAVIVGANDVVNPAAREAEGTPIYGMPVLNADRARHVLICNYDLKPGYAGVENPLYHKTQGVTLLLGNAEETLRELLQRLDSIQV